MIHGKDLILANSGTAIAAAKSCSLQTSTSFIEACSPTDSVWHTYIPTYHECSVSTNCLLTTWDYHKMLMQYQFDKSQLSLSFYDNDLRIYYYCNAYIKSIDLTTDVGSLAKMSVSFQITGALNIAQTQVLNMRNVGTAVTDRTIDWSGAFFSVIKQTSDEDYIEYYQLNATKDTRITLSKRGLVLDATAEEVAENLAAFINPTVQRWFLERILLRNNSTTEEKSIVVKAVRGQMRATIMMNYDDATPPYNVIYLSKQ